MEEDGRQFKRSRHGKAAAGAAASSACSSGAAAPGGGGGRGGESEEERQRREESERGLCKQISDSEGLFGYMMAFLPTIPLMVQLGKSMWQRTAAHLSHITISAATARELSFWQHIPLPFVTTQLAARLTHVTTIILRIPFPITDWCLDVVVAMVEGLSGGTLQTITLEQGDLVRIRACGTREARQAVSRPHPALPARLNPPPTLDAVTTIEGLRREHHALADRGWRMPRFATVRQGHWDRDGHEE
ncbi:unnamed protein product [Vitrella brassicaformis CCMP3155]|uniref:Uncharacterized protein n=2 Tax=Vitrella brassicaformis TaxID=1169539 RepID=A0A0G4G0D4_VITBC|nr:unnamed protein product [Vitrella brassicaformis CCMP3155]|eukprot:CEM21333.1 unnamed protein product [Vitrella brassicaformis CCMP3155]